MAGVGVPPSAAAAAGSGSDKPCMENALLCYTQYHMHRTAKENIADVLCKFFCEEEVITAKEMLKTFYKGRFTYEMKDRRNTTGTQVKPGKNKTDSVINDILSVMYELDEKKIVTEFVVKDLSRLPKCDPKEVDPYSNLQLIIDLQQRLYNLENTAGSMQAQLISNVESIKFNNVTLARHETVYGQHEIDIEEHAKLISNISFPVSGDIPPEDNSGDNTSSGASNISNTTGIDGDSSDNVPSSDNILSSGNAAINNNRSEDSNTPASSLLAVSNESGDRNDRSGGSGDNGVTNSTNTSGQPLVNEVADNNRAKNEMGVAVSKGVSGNDSQTQTPSGGSKSPQQPTSTSRGWSGQPLGLGQAPSGRPPPNTQHQRGNNNTNGSGNRHDGGNNQNGGNKQYGDNRNNNNGDGNWTKIGKNGRPIRAGNQQGKNIFQQQQSRSGRIIGSGNPRNAQFRGAPPPKRDFFLSRLGPETEEHAIIDYLKRNGISDVQLTQLSHPTSSNKSYKLTVNLPDKDTVMSSQLWPENVCIKKYKPRVNSGQNHNL